MEAAARRTGVLASHLAAEPCAASASPPAGGVGSPPSPDDVVICGAVRTAITKAKKGGFRDTPAEDLLAAVLRALVERTGVNPALLGDVIVGTVLGSNVWRANQARIAMLLAGYPDSVPVRIINRQCSSGLQAVADVAASIKAGYYDIAVASGVETMSQDAFTGDVSGAANPKIFENAAARACLLPMGITSENVAQRFGVSREAQDALAAASHARAAAARSAGRFSGEIVPVRTSVKDPATGERTEVVVSEDDGIRAGVTAAQLAALKPAFKAGGSTTAGNASQVSDGAAAVLVARRSAAQRLGLPVLATWRSFAAVGCDPAVMGVGPAVAIPRALALAGVRSVNEIALFELNEAFASQAAYCARTLGLDPARVNVNGGAIALGHPLGATGARCVATLLAELARRGPEARLGVISMCIGSGMGAAAVLEKA